MNSTAPPSIPKLKRLPTALPLDGAVRIELQQGVPIFKASNTVQERIETLLQQQQEGNLTAADEEELDRYEEMDDYLSFVNRAIRNITHLTQESVGQPRRQKGKIMKTIPQIQSENYISGERKYGDKLRKKLIAGDFGEEGVDWEERRHTNPRYYVGPAAEARIIEYARQKGWLNTA